MPGPAGLKDNVGAPLGSKPEHHQDRRGVKKQGARLKPESGMKYTPPPNKPPPKLTEAQKKKNRAAFGFTDAPLTKGQKAKAEAAARLKAEPKLVSRADIQEVKVGAPVRMLGGDKGKYKGGK